MEVNQSPSLSIDTEIDLKVKLSLIEDTLLFVINSNEDKIKDNYHYHYWQIYPNDKLSNKYDKLFCFPFPKELFDGNFLSSFDTNTLLSFIQQK